ncbi:MAG: hypothetical protein L3K14_08815 [Thermoplasmata archaeon]|nr:hypothetical protein [Thermoplasmata archaeon]
MPGKPRTHVDLVGMLRKNITITHEENAFLDRHPEINQSALFRQVVESLMLAERAPRFASAQTLRIGKAVYRSGAVMYQRPGRRRSDSE